MGEGRPLGRQLDKKKQPAGDELSADGGKAGVTGNLLDKIEQPAGEDYRTPRMVQGRCHRQPAGQKRATRR